MGTTYYYTVNDELIGEHTLGQSRFDYIPDALGSVVATVDQTLTVKSTARFKPYGADLATSGTQPAFGYTGNTGSKRTGRPHSDLYNQNRHLGTIDGRWTTGDSLWPLTSCFGYALANPITYLDPDGLRPIGDSSCSQFNGSNYNYLEKINGTIGRICDGISDPKVRSCVRKCGGYSNRCVSVSCIANWCSSNRTISCNHHLNCGSNSVKTITLACPANKCCGGAGSIRVSGACALTNLGSGDITVCTSTAVSSYLGNCGCTSLPTTAFPHLNCNDLSAILLHEMAHSCACPGSSGNPDPTGTGQLQNNMFGYCVAHCLGINPL